MKFDKIIFIFVLLIFAMSCISAAENTTCETLEVDSHETIIENSTPAPTQDEQIASEINITFDEKVYEKNLTNITVSLPEGAQGILNVRINSFTIYNESVSNSTVTIPIKLPPLKYPVLVPNIWPSYDSTRYEVTAFFNGAEVNVTHDLYVMKYPKDNAPSFMIPSEVLQYGQRYSFMPAILFPRSATGTVEIYLDDRLLNATNVTAPFVYIDANEIISLALGNHTLKASYSGDDYYNPCVVKMNFTVVNALISIPSKVYLDHDDVISASVVNTTKGNVSVYVDSKLVVKRAFDKNGEFLFSLFDCITCGVHEIGVVVECENFTREKSVTANTTYSIEVYALYGDFRYGERNVVYVYMPEDMQEYLFNVTVNGVRMPIHKDGQDLLIDVSAVETGNFTVIVSYLGDDKYYPTTVSADFAVEYAINFYESTLYFGDRSKVTITLPPNADGNLSAYINGELYKTVKVTNGTASLEIFGLDPGEYDLNLTYTGSDYPVENISSTIHSYPRMKYESYVVSGTKNVLEFRVPKTCKGCIWTEVNGTNYTATINDGVAYLDFSKLSVGDWDFDVYYLGEDGYNDSYFAGIYVDHIPAKITNAKNAAVRYATGVYKVRVYDVDKKIAKNANVTFKINGKTVKTVKTNAQGWATLSIPAKYVVGKYTISAQYKNVKVSKKLTVKHAITLSTVKIKKSAKKLVLTAKLDKSLKGKTVKFTFNGKSIKTKVNAKGIAKATVTKAMLSKLKVGSKVTYKATYLKDTVKKSAKVLK